MYVSMQQHWAVCFAFRLTFSDSLNTIFMLDRFIPCFIQHFISDNVILNVKIPNFEWSDTAIGSVLSEKVFLNISQISQENICVGVFFNKATGRKTFLL